jgi:hypothetical protein
MGGWLDGKMDTEREMDIKHKEGKEKEKWMNGT